MSGVTNINILSTDSKKKNMYIYFIYGTFMYCIKFTDQSEDHANWSKYITYTRNQAVQKSQPIKFENFDTIPKANRFDELFCQDKVDYSYEAIKIKCEKDRRKRMFDFDNLNINDPGNFF